MFAHSTRQGRFPESLKLEPGGVKFVWFSKLHLVVGRMITCDLHTFLGRWLNHQAHKVQRTGGSTGEQEIRVPCALCKWKDPWVQRPCVSAKWSVVRTCLGTLSCDQGEQHVMGILGWDSRLARMPIRILPLSTVHIIDM